MREDLAAVGLPDDQAGALEGGEVVGDGARAEAQGPGDPTSGPRAVQAAQDRGPGRAEEGFEGRDLGEVPAVARAREAVGASLETVGRDGAIVQADTPDRCRAELARAPGTVVIEVYRVDDACGVVEELAQLLAPRFE